MNPTKQSAKPATPPQAEDMSEYDEWLDEELARFNKMGETVQRRGIGIDGKAGPSPPLNPDGTLAQQPAKPAP